MIYCFFAFRLQKLLYVHLFFVSRHFVVLLSPQKFLSVCQIVAGDNYKIIGNNKTLSNQIG